MPTERPKFREVYDRHFDYVWNSLRRLAVPERDLEDVCHEVFVVAYKNYEDYDPERPMQPWLFGIAFRVASDYRNKASNERELLTEPEAPSRPSEADRKLDKKEARNLVMEALEGMDVEKRAVFILNKLDGHAMPEIAETMSVPLNTAYSRLRLAKEEFTENIRALRNKKNL